MLLLVESSFKLRIRLDIRGIVQGVGFRPFIYKLAKENNLKGYVLNNGEGVVVEAEGLSSEIQNFETSFNNNLPSLARVDKYHKKQIKVVGENTFSIIESTLSNISTMLPADISLCDECRAEMNESTNRRYKYPFINCTNCGPRYTIVNKLPYDRAFTSMKEFAMCEACEQEYNNPNDRRYHAQPISCFDCGPTLKLNDSSVDEITEILNKLSNEINKNNTVAIKGIGGFHLICNATSQEAVLKLRENKNRRTKPFAVMFNSIKSIKEVCEVAQSEEILLLSKERPIVLLKKRIDAKLLADEVAPNIEKVGAFLAYTPLHELLLDILKFPIVATSANLSDEPIIRKNTELLKKLSSVVSLSLTHNREIFNACDDSVLMQVQGKTLSLRLSRGYTPKSFILKNKINKNILALGANQKNTISLAFNENIIISPHIGDLNSLDAFEYFLRTIQTFKELYNFEPDIIVCDKHPQYETTKWAENYVKNNSNIPLVKVQHHYAHALACMAEYNLNEEVLAFCFDGTGYGDDGSIWGGEVLLATPKRYERVYHLKEYVLLGADKAVKEPRRVALALLFECFSLDEILNIDNALIRSYTQQEIKTFYQMKSKNLNSPKTTSFGRLFDGVYALSGHLNSLSYEGESGMIMEGYASDIRSDDVYHYELNGNIIEYEKMIKEILDENDKKIISVKFINTIVKIIVDISLLHKELAVVLSGGVFQNSILIEKLMYHFDKNNIEYYIQSQTPVNDGGISLGQAFYALNINNQEELK